MERQHAEGAVKVAEDLARYKVALDKTHPEVVVECGTWWGESALWFARHGVDVVTVDVNPGLISEEASQHPRVTQVAGDSAAPAVVAKVAEAVNARRAMVVLDSDHSPYHVRREIEGYGPLVAVGCYLVVEDTLLRWVPSPFPHPMPGPLDAVELLLADRPDWRRDEELERVFPVSMNPAGWWVRVGA